MSAIPKKVADRFQAVVGNFQKVLRNAKDRDINESDTVMIVTDVLSDVLGYDKYSEITSKQAIRGAFRDLAVRVDDQIKFLIEVKAIGIPLKEDHLRQCVDYRARGGILSRSDGPQISMLSPIFIGANPQSAIPNPQSLSPLVPPWFPC